MRQLFKSENLNLGFVMVKPHAFGMCVDPLVSEILEGDGLANLLEPDDQLRPVLDKITPANPIIRDLSTVPYGSKFLELLYGDKSTRRYYPLIQEYYLGKIAIIPYLYEGISTNMPLVYKAIKGTSETRDPQGKPIDKPNGIRGLLSEPYILYDDQASVNMDDGTYRRRYTPVINNYIHVSDSEAEIAAGLQLAYTPKEWATALGSIT